MLLPRCNEDPDCCNPRGFRIAIYHTVFVRGFATTSVATHLTLTYGFPHIWVSEPGGCIGPTEPLAECQRHSPEGLVMHYRNSNPQPFDYRPSNPPLHHQFLKQAATAPPIPSKPPLHHQSLKYNQSLQLIFQRICRSKQVELTIFILH